MFMFTSRPLATINNRMQQVRDRLGQDFIEKLDDLHTGALRTGLVSFADLQEAYRKSCIPARNGANRVNMIWYIVGIMVFIMLATPIFYETITFLLGVRCFLPNNHLVWEATRPISDCVFCKDVKGPRILMNLTRKQFTPYAYSSQPIIVKQAVAHWPAMRKLTYAYLKDLYESTPGALDADCQFEHFNSDLKSLRDVFGMPKERANLTDGSAPWYIGWRICHDAVLQELRKLYVSPHFLPKDAEMPHGDFIYLGYEQGAVMHLDYIPRLLWQAQLKGNKSWLLAPTPECDNQCQSFSFYVEPGDAVLVDTRNWYHANTIPKGQFSLTIQSEYG